VRASSATGPAIMENVTLQLASVVAILNSLVMSVKIRNVKLLSAMAMGSVTKKQVCVIVTKIILEKIVRSYSAMTAMGGTVFITRETH